MAMPLTSPWRINPSSTGAKSALDHVASRPQIIGLPSRLASIMAWTNSTSEFAARIMGKRIQPTLKTFAGPVFPGKILR